MGDRPDRESDDALAHRWADVAGPEDLAAFRKAGFGHRSGFGTHPALLVIDITRGWVEPRFPKGGAHAAGVVSAIAPLLDAAREAGVPVFYFRGNVQTEIDAGGRLRKSQAVLDPLMLDAVAREWPGEIAPLPHEPVIEKTKSSPFFETPLRSMLTFLAIDTVVLCGLSTSGCIQAAALDAASCNLRVVVPEECVGDRAPTFHRYALCNIHMRYGDVLPAAEVEAWFERLADHRIAPGHVAE
jgi:maleamate amidohydrolase